MESQIQPLAVDLSRLEGLSERLVTSHHENNYAGAVKRLNAIRQQLATLDWNAAPVFVVNGLKREELVAANSAWLHELYFETLGGDGVLSDGGLVVAIERDFGSFDRWRAEFTGLAKAMGGGSGWALMSLTARDGRLVTHWAGDHTQLLAGATPVLALDMYEHSYHLDFGAKAAAYVDAFMRNLRWAGVAQRFRAAAAAASAGLSVSPREADAGAQWIDVRRIETFAQARDQVEGAAWRDPVQLPTWSVQLDRARPVVVYCVHGLEVSQTAALALQAQGFEARYVAGGIEACRAAGLPLSPTT
jgi:Fe-Mn family superoxide dismutase